MSRARHHEKRAMGGGTKPVWEAGGETNAAKEAEDKKEGSEMAKGRKRGGHVMKGEGEAPKHRADRRARGGKVEHHGAHKPGRKAGGGVGANRTPLSTAATIKEVTKGEQAEDSPKSN